MNRKVKDDEHVARILKSVWLYDGVVSPAAFHLRPSIKESYVSVLREDMDSFQNDLKKVTHDKNGSYMSMSVSDIHQLTVPTLEDKVLFHVLEQPSNSLPSHAGIYIKINDQYLVGGEPFESLAVKKGIPGASVLLEIKRALADLGKKNIIQFSISSSENQ